MLEQMGIKVLKDTELDSLTYATMAKGLVDRTFQAGETVFTLNEVTEAALFLVRSGKAEITCADGTKTDAVSGGYFGEDMLVADVQTGRNGVNDPATISAGYTVTITEDCVCGVLTLYDLRRITNTLYIGKGAERPVRRNLNIKLEDMKRIKILGAGTFGQVWLVTLTPKAAAAAAAQAGPNSTTDFKKPYALKIQAKYELVQDGQAKAVVQEKHIMSQLNHPFIINLESAFQDDSFVYMLMGLVQGGELFSLLHGKKNHGLKSEVDARFYAAGIAEGLAYMHRRYVQNARVGGNVLFSKRVPVANHVYPCNHCRCAVQRVCLS
jgi:Protein kinase domain